MPTRGLEVGSGQNRIQSRRPSPPVPDYHLTFVDQPSTLGSLVRGLRAWLTEPKARIPREYYRGEATLPVVEMGPWYSDLPGQIRGLFEKRDLSRVPEPIRKRIRYNQKQEERRLLLATVLGITGAAASLFLWGPETIALGMPLGYLAGYLFSTAIFRKVEEYPDIWKHYPMQAGSWMNSMLVHALAILALVLPYMIQHMLHPPKKAVAATVIDISPYLADLPASLKQAGGGGGGGDRSPTPASKGPVPRFAKEQLAPPLAKIENMTPKMPVQPTLLGPPEMKLPQMQASLSWGDPTGVPGPPSNGPGTGGGIGSGEGTGVGSGKGGGLGPGEGGGTGGGIFSVGGNVSAPVPIYKPEPPYSEEARKAKYQGIVVLSIVVDQSGTVQDARVVKPLGLGLDENAVQTVKTWKFLPAKRNGAPVPVRVMVEVTFRLF